MQTVETEVLKLDTLTDIYEQEKEKIDAEENTLNLEELDELDGFGQYERLERHQQLEQRDKMNESLMINIRDIQEKIGNAIKQR